MKKIALGLLIGSFVTAGSVFAYAQLTIGTPDSKGCIMTSTDNGNTYHSACPPIPVTAISAPGSALISNSNGVSVYRITDSAYGAACYVIPSAGIVAMTNTHSAGSIYIPAISCISTK